MINSSHFNLTFHPHLTIENGSILLIYCYGHGLNLMMQEYFIRHVNGYALNSENDKQRVVKCLEAAIERRVCEVKRQSQNCERKLCPIISLALSIQSNR